MCSSVTRVWIVKIVFVIWLFQYIQIKYSHILNEETLYTRILRGERNHILCFVPVKYIQIFGKTDYSRCVFQMKNWIENCVWNITNFIQKIELVFHFPNRVIIIQFLSVLYQFNVVFLFIHFYVFLHSIHVLVHLTHHLFGIKVLLSAFGKRWMCSVAFVYACVLFNSFYSKY